VLAGVLAAVGTGLLLVGVVLWTAGPRIRRHFSTGLP
jgi:hypothetical protein